MASICSTGSSRCCLLSGSSSKLTCRGNMALVSIINSNRSSSSITTSFVSSPRLSLLFALSSQVALQAQRSLQGFASEAVKYANPKRQEARNLEEALMSVPDLETIPYQVLRRENDYEIRDVESYMVAETSMPGKTGFDFYGSSQGFNTLASYLFGKNTRKDEMEMTTPVLVSQRQGTEGEKMDMTTPVISQKGAGEGEWKMAFVMPSKYGEDLPLPVDGSVKIRRVPAKMIAVTAFSGYVTDEEVKKRERSLRDAVKKDSKVRVKESARVEVSQFNPPFTPPFMRRNEVALEVEPTDG